MAKRIKTCSETPMVYNSSTSYTFNSSCEQALNLWEKKTLFIISKTHQNKFLESCDWRKNTLMPIFKIKTVQIDKQDHYPKRAFIESERVEKYFSDLKQISLPQALYLLRQTMLGMEVVTQKYGRIDIDQICLGINPQGKSKLWLSDETLVLKKLKVSSSTPGELLLSIFTLVFGIVKICYRRFLKNLYLDITQQTQNVTFSEIHQKMRSYVQQRKINVPDSLNASSSFLQRICLKNMEKYIIRSSLSKRKRKEAKSPNTRSYVSPVNKKKSNISSSFRESIDFGKKNMNKNAQTHSLKNLLSVSEHKKNRQKTTPLRRKNQESIDLAHSFPIRISASTCFNKKSDATTHNTENIYGSKDDLPFEKLTSYRQTSSILMQNYKETKINLNLGSLDPVPEYEVQNSNEGEGKMSESLVSYSQQQRDEVHEIKLSCASKKLDDFWQKKFVNLFEQNCRQLKESVHCGGEQKRASHLDVKLQILGKFGRNICGSICPLEGQF